MTHLDNGPEGEYLTERLTDETIAFMKSHRAEPFFVALWNYTVHWPMEAPPELIAKYKDRPGLKDHRYAAMIEAMDIHIGRVLDALDELKLADETLVIFTSDNGAFGGVTDLHPTGDQGTGDHGAEAFHGEHPVDRQPEQARHAAFGHLVADCFQYTAELRQALFFHGGNRHDRGILQKRTGRKFPDILHRQLQPLFIDHIDLGQRHKPVFDAQQLADFHVFPGLRHDAFVGGDDHDHDIDTGGAGHHVLDEFFMTGDVYNADMLPVRQVQGGEAQLDCNSALFLLLQAVGVGAGDRFDQ
jgi:hypothetical protein